MDHLARIAMKNAANCVKYGELQGFRNRYTSNAYCGPVIYLPGPRLSEGLLNCNKRVTCGHPRLVIHVGVLDFTPGRSGVVLCENGRREGSMGVARAFQRVRLHFFFSPTCSRLSANGPDGGRRLRHL